MAGLRWCLLGDPTKFRSASPSHPPRKGDITNRILAKLESRIGMDATRLHDFAHDVSGMESRYGADLVNPTSTAKGIYQFTDDSFVTAKNRLRNILGYVPKNIQDTENVNDLSSADQKALFFAHLTQDKGSDDSIVAYLEGSSGAPLYVRHHYKGDPDAATRKRMKKFFK